ncbi:MoaD/ThiS family protein [Asticcacaulis sp. 201]|uniref:MoaD/ThiS family protein n=1 Tax=Asticcacaulis sp. 201 TaxID=3028787 RepID=UPI002916CC33|nr:MoaD/ThiS family protein [Asticcacaulis sp. 201]MDV6330432.1 MoaD/ThiS family protein [Asticcacaulis sp. 201]
MIDILFFGRIADIMGRRRLSLDLPDGGLSLLALRAQLFTPHGDVTPLMSVNQQVESGDRPLSDGDEVAFFSVFSGG